MEETVKACKFSKYELFIIMSLAVHWFEGLTCAIFFLKLVDFSFVSGGAFVITETDIEIPLDLKYSMAATAEKILSAYKNHLFRKGLSKEMADKRQRIVIEFSKMVGFHGDQWFKLLLSANNTCVTTSLLSIANVVPAIR